MALPLRHDSPLKALLSGVVDVLRRGSRVGTLADDVRLDGRTCMVTGANSGLGKAIATELARRGGRVIMACRRNDEGARDEIRQRSGNREVSLEHVDLADLRSVEAFRQRMGERGERFDITVLNAGIAASRSRRTPQGFEELFAVDYLANFALVNGLLADGTIPNRSMRKPPTDGATTTGSRILFVSSEAHRTADPVDFRTLGQFRRYGMSGSMAEYGRAKLLLTTYAVELSRRLVAGGDLDVGVHALCPGAVNTNIAREAPRWTQPLLKAVFGVIFRSPQVAAEPAVYLACEPSLQGSTCHYLHIMERKEPSALALDPAAGRALWEASEALLASSSEGEPR